MTKQTHSKVKGWFWNWGSQATDTATGTQEPSQPRPQQRHAQYAGNRFRGVTRTSRPQESSLSQGQIRTPRQRNTTATINDHPSDTTHCAPFNTYHYTDSTYQDHGFRVGWNGNARYPAGEYPSGTEPGVRRDYDDDEDDDQVPESLLALSEGEEEGLMDDDDEDEIWEEITGYQGEGGRTTDGFEEDRPDLERSRLTLSLLVPPEDRITEIDSEDEDEDEARSDNAVNGSSDENSNHSLRLVPAVRLGDFRTSRSQPNLLALTAGLNPAEAIRPTPTPTPTPAPALPNPLTPLLTTNLYRFAIKPRNTIPSTSSQLQPVHISPAPAPAERSNTPQILDISVPNVTHSLRSSILYRSASRSSSLSTNPEIIHAPQFGDIPPPAPPRHETEPELQPPASTRPQRPNTLHFRRFPRSDYLNRGTAPNTTQKNKAIPPTRTRRNLLRHRPSRQNPTPRPRRYARPVPSNDDLLHFLIEQDRIERNHYLTDFQSSNKWIISLVFAVLLIAINVEWISLQNLKTTAVGTWSGWVSVHSIFHHPGIDVTSFLERWRECPFIFEYLHAWTLQRFC